MTSTRARYPPLISVQNLPTRSIAVAAMDDGFIASIFCREPIQDCAHSRPAREQHDWTCATIKSSCSPVWHSSGTLVTSAVQATLRQHGDWLYSLCFYGRCCRCPPDRSTVTTASSFGMALLSPKGLHANIQETVGQ